MIYKLTKVKEAQIPVYREKWLAMPLRPMNHERARAAVTALYRRMDEAPPKILIAQSPLQAALMVLLCRQLKTPLVDKKDQLWDQLRDQLGGQLGDQLAEINNDWFLLTGYEAWAAWFEYGAFIGAKLDQEKFVLFNQCVEELCFLLPYKSLCVISEKPTEIHWRNRRLHRDGGLAVKFADGWGLHMWNGVRMEPWMIETPAEQLDVDRVLQVKNVEQRTACLQKIGIERFIQKVGAATIHTQGDYSLLEIPLNGRPARYLNRYLKMKNPSMGVWHVEGVPNTCKTVAEALHSRKPAAMQQLPVSEDGADWYEQGDVCIWPKDATSLKARPTVLT